MVMQKRLDYGFNGYQVPFVPRAARSARRRVSFGSRVEDKQMCAFDLLASVAGKLLLEKETTPTSTSTSTDKGQFAAVNNSVKEEYPDDGRPFEEVTCDERSRDKSFFVSEILSSGYSHDDLRCKGDLHLLNRISLGVDSVINSVDCSERFDAEKLGRYRSKNSLGSIANRVDVGSIYRKPDRCKLESETRQLVNGSGIDMCSSENKAARDGKPVLASSDSSIKVPLCGKQTPHTSFPASREDVYLVSKDDEENSSWCTHHYTSKKFFRPKTRIGDRRIKKILASRHWKVAPKSKYTTRCNAVKDMKPFSRYKKEFYKHQRSERIYPFKKRKHFDCSSASNSDGGICLEFLSDSSDRINNVEGSGSYLKMHGATGASSTVAGQNTSFQSRDPHVKLRIRSFRVPELFIEIPESATVGSLKRTVMEAVTTILGGGLRVGVLLQGKKVGDDNKTLLQTGISQDNHLDALGFSLEPNSSQSSPSLCPRDTPLMLPGDVSQPLTRHPPSPGVIRNSICSPSTELHVHSAPSLTNLSVDKSTMDRKVLVSVPAMSVEALAVVPIHRRSKCSETVQRRIRRPFSVAEVEALVQAVEKLGTGRWRDVKLRAFNNAKYRTYVDLKDKWKTLVHTARISPQQRRGEPVPQELLDRVLSACAYWSQRQAKHQLKQQPEMETKTCLLL